MKRKGSAVWNGGLKDGKGAVSTESGALSDVGYNFAKRFGEEKGTNPEELVAAAHASCYAMQLSGVVGEAGLVADEIRASAVVSGDASSGAFTVKSSHLSVEGKVPGASEEQFREAAQKAKEICPISRLLHGSVDITVDAKLVA